MAKFGPTAILVLLGSLLGIGPIFAATATVPIQTILLEGADQSLEGQAAIGEVIRTRARERQQTFEQVCLAPKQFSAWDSTKYAKWRLFKATPYEYARAKRAWELSEHTSYTHGANLYHADYVMPSWSRSQKVHRTVKLGSHVFYKESRTTSARL